MSTSLEETLTLLYPKFEEYINKFGKPIAGQPKNVTKDGWMRCINPNHNDYHPSMSMGGKGRYNGIVAHCFSCKNSYNIIHAAHLLENRPITGVEFFNETLPYLCSMFDIPYAPEELSDDAKRDYQKRRAYVDVVNLCYSNMFNGEEFRTDHPAIKHLLARGISLKSIHDFKIGCVNSFDEHQKQLAEMGYSDREWINGADLANKNLFSKTGIIIPIYDDKNRPVGFVTRKTDMAPNDHGNEKYINSQNSDIYKKSEILFNFNNVKFTPQGKIDGPIIIVEGYLDAIMLHQEGFKNVVALGSTVLTEAHVDLLFNKNASKIIVMLDGDEAGRKGTRLALERLAVYKNFIISVVDLDEGVDPDTYYQTHGFQETKNLFEAGKALTPFAWTLKHSTFEDDPLIVAEKAIPIIAAEEQLITRLQMIRDLSNLTGITDADLRKDVDSLLNKKSLPYLEELNKINNYIQVKLQKSKVSDTKSILKDAIAKLEHTEQKFGATKDIKEDFSMKLSETKMKINEGKYKFGLYTPNHKDLQETLDGIPFNTCMTLVGGRPSSGKTSWLTNVCIDVIDSNPDAVIVYMSIDDTAELMIQKILAIKSGLSVSKIKAIKDADEESKARLNEAWAWFDSVSDRFFIPDASVGNTVETFENHLDYVLKNFPDHKILTILDNFHKVRCDGRNGKMEAVSELSERIKTSLQIKNIHCMMTTELRKPSNNTDKPNLSDLKDSVQLEYDADVIILVHNEYHLNNDTNLVRISRQNIDIKEPFIEARICKNKVTGKLKRLAYVLNPINLKFESIPEAMMIAKETEKPVRKRTARFDD